MDLIKVGITADETRPTKRRRTAESQSIMDSSSTSSSTDFEDEIEHRYHGKTSPRIFDGIKVPRRVRPLSQYTCCTPRPSPTSEAEALEELLYARRSPIESEDSSEDEEIMLELRNFCIYRPGSNKDIPSTFAHLHELMYGCGKAPGFSQSLMFDGFLQINEKRYWVEKAQFDVLAAGGYEVEVTTVSDQIYVQTRAAKRRGVWYRLLDASRDYNLLHSNYLWIADFAKHFICYLQETPKVDLRDFKAKFCVRMAAKYSNNHIFQAWHKRYDCKRDFRKVVAAYPEYLRREALSPGVDDSGTLRDQPIWGECHPS